jgi:hypothetical protein
LRSDSSYRGNRPLQLRIDERERERERKRERKEREAEGDRENRAGSEIEHKLRKREDWTVIRIFLSQLIDHTIG